MFNIPDLLFNFPGFSVHLPPDWAFKILRITQPDFWRVHTSPGGIHGALQKRRAPVTGTGVTAFECTIAVEDVAATAAAIETHGGQLTMQPFEMEHVGTFVMFKDTEGNTVGAMQYLPGIR